MGSSLYERLGGIEAIMAAVGDFEDRVGKDDRINRKFAKSDLDRFVKELADQLCETTGGPCTYTGRTMKQAHTDMGVTNGEFDALIEDLVATLDNFKVGKGEQGEVLSLLNPLREEIVEVDSSQVGTALPSTFVPAPPLG